MRLSGELRAMPRETLASAAARAPDMDPIGRFADLVHAALHGKHRAEGLGAGL